MVNDQGRLWRRDGFQKLFSGQLFDGAYANQDLHDQDGLREAITLIYENTAPDGSRSLITGTQKKLRVLDESTGQWTDITGGNSLGATSARFKAASSQDYVIFTNNLDDVYTYDTRDGDFATIPDLNTYAEGDDDGCGFKPGLRKAKVIIQFAGFTILMNVEEGETPTRFASRIRWSDQNRPRVWGTGIYLEDALQDCEDEDAEGIASIAGFQDLTYGDEILAAEILGNNVIIYTARSIWRMYLSATTNSDGVTQVFGFSQLYSDRATQKGCLAYPNTLVSNGKAHYYMSRDGVYKWDIYSSEPERVPWIHDSSAVIYSSDYDSQIDTDECESPISMFRAERDEIWFSWPDQDGSYHTLCCNTRFNTCDYMDVGWTALGAFTPNADCQTVGTKVVGASSFDWCLKEIGGVWYREYHSVTDDLTINLTDGSTLSYYQEGYDSILRGQIPTPRADLEKIVRHLEIEHDTKSTGGLVELRVGNSYVVCDPNASSGRCAVQWREHETKTLECPNELTDAQLTTKNQKPYDALDWALYEQNRFIYFDLTITGSAGPATGANTAWSKIEFEAMTL